MNEEGDDSTSRPTGSLSFNGVGPRSLSERLAKATDVLSNTLEGLKKIMDLRNEYDDSVADYDAHMSILLEYICFLKDIRTSPCSCLPASQADFSNRT